jgi:uroporphyrinogen decarboxylase
MTPRERIILALKHKEADRIPVDLGATDSSGITAIAYNKLKKEIGCTQPVYVNDLVQMIARVGSCVSEFVGSDVIPLLIEPKKRKVFKIADGLEVLIPAKAIIKNIKGENLLFSANGEIIGRCAKNGLYFDPVYFPLENVQSIDDIKTNKIFLETFDWPDYWDETFTDLREKAICLYNNYNQAIVGNLCIHLYAACQFLRGFNNFMMDLVSDKKLARFLMESQIEAYLPRIDKYIDAVGDYIDIILVNDDLGMQNGLQISKELYLEMVKPYQKKLWSYIKHKSKKPLLLHSCGAVSSIIPDLIESGVDALNPIQVSAAGMDTGKLKKEFGSDIVFWGGGCDTQSVLSRGTVREVKNEVRKRIDDLAPGGGFVFCQVHNIQADVPVENILAMYEELGTIKSN